MNVIVIPDQILIGTVLGGSSLVKPPKGTNYYLSMRDQNELWLKYKMAELPIFYDSINVQKYGNTFRCNSSCHKILTNFYEQMYKNNRRVITMDLLNPLRDVGIAVWYLDNGGKAGREKKNAYINTTKFGEEGTKIIQQYFCEVDIECNINRNKDRLKVLFTVEGTINLFYTIAHCFPEFMYHRL